ncbi:MAG: hypothetical protein L0H93_05250, partial [Nocardioides sp.]|nr:hypothetical protein [Nocardioides sp.]
MIARAPDPAAPRDTTPQDTTPQDKKGTNGNPDRRRDLRMPALGVAAWVGGLGGLLAPLVSLVVALPLGALSIALVRRPGLRRSITAWLLVAVAVGASAALRDLAVGTGPVAQLAPTRTAVTAQVTVAGDPRRIPGD